MKKILLMMAVAALVLASCSSDETIAVNESDAISFRSLTNNVTRAADITAASDLASFNVFAKVNGGGDYIGTSTGTPSAVTFTGPTTYTSVSKYYWPQSGSLDFYAWSANSVANGNKEGNVSVSDYLTYGVTVPSTAGDQPDFIYASLYNQGKVASVPLTFNHYESRIVLKVKNTASNLKFTVTRWKIVYPDNTGTVTFTTPESTLTATWTDNITQAVANEFISAVTSVDFNAGTTTASQLGTDPQQMIMIPQDVVGATPGALAYIETEPFKLNRAYIAIEYSAENTTNSDVITSGWRCWPLPASTTWDKGKQYTYVIDIADGGYKEVDPNTGDGNTDPVPEFQGSLIQFSSITVTGWTTVADQNVTQTVTP